MLTFNDLKSYNFKEIFQVNPDLKIQSHQIDSLDYITVDDFFVYPEKVVDFLKQFPCDDIIHKIQNNYKIGDTVDENVFKPLGIQQLLPNRYFDNLSFNLFSLLSDADFITTKSQEVLENYDKFSKYITQFVYYTNFYYPNMICINQNHTPHFDQYEYAYNIYLSEDVGGGTAFYKLKYNNRYYDTIQSIVEDTQNRVSIGHLLNNYKQTDSNIIKEYIPIDDDNVFTKYHLVECKYNRLVLYKGNYWHSAYYNSKEEKNSRYSLASTFTYDRPDDNT